MQGELTHASFFSGAGGLDLGLERAGWRTVSFSEIDPYASAVLAQRWPGVPNLGDIVGLRSDDLAGSSTARHSVAAAEGWHGEDGRCRLGTSGTATLWSGGFPCQDLSVAGKRRGMGAGTRSGLAFSFLDLVGRHRPRFVLLENVPGLLSSHAGRDFGTLLSTLVELGYGVGYRVLDARYFGVPQRRRRVFILGDSTGGRVGAERAAEVLSVGSRCRRHPPTGVEAGADVADGARPGVDIARTVVGTAGKRHDEDIDTLVPQVIGPMQARRGGGWRPNAEESASGYLQLSPPPDASRVREADGLARGPHDRDGVADTLRVGGRASGAGDSYDNTPWIAESGVAKSLLAKGNSSHAEDLDTYVSGFIGMTDDPLLPLGLDSHRYRCCGNGVVADVGEWIGLRLAAIA